MRTVLLIEDDIPLSWLLSKVLGQSVKVVVVKNGFEGWSWLQSGNHADLIVSDLHMSGIDGFELLENLKSSALYGDIPVFIITGDIDPKVARSVKALGAEELLIKPFEPDLLRRMSVEIIESRNKAYA